MPGYIRKLLDRHKHPAPTKPQHAPHPIPPRTYGAESQKPNPTDTSPPIDEHGIKRIQQIVGGILYYARAVDVTVLAALSTLAAEQTTATERTRNKVTQLLDYLATHPNATIRYRASDMKLNAHSDASYLSEKGARSRAAGYFFLGGIPTIGKPIRLNGAILVLSSILKCVAASAAEAELGALFLNLREARIIKLTLEELGHPQDAVSTHCDNTTAVGIANGTVKQQRSRAMEMRYFWVCDQVKRGLAKVEYHPGQECLADYPSKHHDARHHQKVRPIYQHEKNSPLALERALKPSDLRGCVGSIPGGYKRSSPMPEIQRAIRRLASTRHRPLAYRSLMA